MKRIISLKSTKRITFMGGIAAAVALFVKGSMFSDVRNSISTKFSELTANVSLPNWMDSARNKTQYIGEAFSNATSSISTKFSELTGDIHLSDLMDVVRNKTQSISESFSNATSSISTKFGELTANVSMSDWMDSARNKTQYIGEVLSNTASSIGTKLSELMSANNQTPELANATRNSTQSSSSTLAGNIYPSDLMDAVRNKAQYVGETLQQAAVQYITNPLSDAKEFIANSAQNAKEFIATGTQSLKDYITDAVNTNIAPLFMHPAKTTNQYLDKLAKGGWIADSRSPYSKSRDAIEDGADEATAAKYQNEADANTASLYMSAVAYTTLALVSIYTLFKTTSYINNRIKSKKVAELNKTLQYIDSVGSSEANYKHYVYSGNYLSCDAKDLAKADKGQEDKPSSTVHAQGAACVKSPEIAMQRA